MIPRGAMAAAGRARRARVALQRRRAPAAVPYAEDYYLQLDQPSQYLRTLEGEATGLDAAQICIAVKLRARPTVASAGNAALASLDLSTGVLPGQSCFFGVSNGTNYTVGGWRTTNANAFASVVQASDAGARVYILHVDRVEQTWRQVQSAAGAVVSASSGTYTGDLRAAVDVWLGRWSFSTATLTQQWVWGAVFTALPTDEQVASWSGGVVDPRLSLPTPLFWRADTFDGSAMPNEGSGPVAPLSGVNCTVADKVAA